MLDTPRSIKELFKRDSVLKNFRVHFPDGEYSDICNDQIVSESVKFRESLCSRDKIKFGYCEQSVLNFSCVGVENIKGMRIQAQYEIDISSLSTEERAVLDSYNESDSKVPFPYYVIPLGIFYVDDCRMDTSMMKRNVTAYSQAMDDITDSEDGTTITLFKTSQTVKELMHLDFKSEKTFNIYMWNLIAVYMGDAFYGLISPYFKKLEVAKDDNWDGSWAVGDRNEIMLDNGRPLKIAYKTKGRWTHQNSSPSDSNRWPNCRVIAYTTGLPKVRDYINSFFNWLNSTCMRLYGSTLTPQSEQAIRINFANTLSWKTTLIVGSTNYSVKITDNYRSGFFPYYDEIEVPASLTSMKISCDGQSAEYTQTYTLSEDDVAIYGIQNISWAQPWYLRVGLPAWNETVTTEKVKYKALNTTLTRWSLENFFSEFFISFTKTMVDYVEISAQIAGFDRYGQYRLYSLKNGMGLFPDAELYPSDAVYPADETNAGRVTRDDYISAWIDDNYIQFGSVTCIYKDASNEVVEYTKLIDEENYESMEVYDLSQNAYLQACGLAGQYSIIENAVDNIAEALTGFTYIPADVKLKGLPYIECGDSIWIRMKNRTYVTSVLQNTISGIQDLRQQISSK